ncbi:MAG: hypothetical protein WCP91_01120 [Candidatus Berkelbacteria bacterium]
MEKTTTLPKLTHLQYLVLGHINRPGLPETSGKSLRQLLNDCGIGKTIPAFYQLMARLEESGYVVGEYHKVQSGNQVYRERHYWLTDQGVREAENSRIFYNST